jgi:hypothetical protein
MYQTWVAKEIQKLQLQEDGGEGEFANIYDDDQEPFLAEMSPGEGYEIPFVIRMGPSNDPDPGSRKRFRALEIDGDGRAFVMIWIDRRLVAKGWLYANETPEHVRRLNIPRGLGTGYGIDFMIAHQGTLVAVEVFWDPMKGGQE